MVGKTKENSPEKEKSPQKDIDMTSVKEQVAEAKIRFLKNAEQYDPISMVRKHPYISLVGSFMTGFGIHRSMKLGDYLSLLPVGIQIAALSAKLGLLMLDKHERS